MLAHKPVRWVRQARLNFIPSLSQIALMCLIRFREGCLRLSPCSVADLIAPAGASPIQNTSSPLGNLLSAEVRPEVSRRTDALAVICSNVFESRERGNSE